MAEAAKRNVAFVLPSDHIVAASIEAGAEAQTVIDIPIDRMGLDIGPRTVADFIGRLAGAKTVIWNGPLGLFENPAFANGTLAVGEAIANLPGVTSVIGGGDTAAAVAGAPGPTASRTSRPAAARRSNILKVSSCRASKRSSLNRRPAGFGNRPFPSHALVI